MAQFPGDALPCLSNLLLTSRRTEPYFEKSIRLGKGLFSHCVVACLDRIVAPFRGSFFFGGTCEWISIECFRVGLESSDRIVSSVRQDYLCPGQRDLFGPSVDPEGDDPRLAFHDASLVGTGADVGHDPVQIH